MARVHIWLAISLLLAACNSDGLHFPPPDMQGADAGACGAATDPASCQAIPGCLALTCPACGGGVGVYFGCIPEGQPHGVDCSDPCAQPACADLDTAAACDARPDCLSLYSGNLPCNSTACENQFMECLDGGTAVCAPPAPGGDSCTRLDAECVPGDAAIYFANGCFEGCIHSGRCAP